MSRLLAPYHDAMRLGMGFNTFTQERCINDAVSVAGHVPIDERHLRSQPMNISQEVIWTAKFVDRVSEVVDSLNISGSLQIKSEALGGGAKASASFVDTDKMKESDISYLIQVRVINQRLQVEGEYIPQFSPLPNISNSEFTRIYGDSYISGWVEGGEFNALVSIKLNDRSSLEQIKGELEVNFNVAKIVNIEGSGAVSKEKSQSNIDGETSISVSWRGGGDIQGAETTDWTLESLKKVAMAFPQKVMACPIRTSAILTKYTALKSFYETTLKASPLDYENAGVYSSALLDSYLDYKSIWQKIQKTAWDVEHGEVSLTVKPQLPQFAQLAAKAKEMYDKRSAASSGTASDLSLPMAPNEIIPYQATMFGLDQARQECRFEMLKIVQEVDAVARDPKIACDATRLHQFLAPAIFRMLLPTATTIDAHGAKYNRWAPFALNTPVTMRNVFNQVELNGVIVANGPWSFAIHTKSDINLYMGFVPMTAEYDYLWPSSHSRQCSGPHLRFPYGNTPYPFVFEKKNDGKFMIRCGDQYKYTVRGNKGLGGLYYGEAGPKSVEDEWVALPWQYS